MGVGPGPQIQVKNNRDNSLNGEGTATVHHAINRASCQLRPPQSCGQQQPVERAEDAISTDQLVSASHRLGRNEAVDGSQSSWVRDEPHYECPEGAPSRSLLPQGEFLVRQGLEEELVRDLEVGTTPEDPPRWRFKGPERRHRAPRTRQRYLLTGFDPCEELGQMNLDLGNIDLNIHVIRIAVREQHDQAPTAGRRTHRPTPISVSR